MKTLNKLLLTSLIGAGSLGLAGKGYGQDTVWTNTGYEVYDEKKQIITRLLKKNDATHIDLLEYNDKGQRIKREWLMGYKNEDPELQLTELYEYNSKGQLIKEIDIDKNGKTVYVKEYNK